MSDNAVLWVLDRVEDGGRAVLVSDAGDERIVPRTELPADVREGDALRELHGQEASRYVIDEEETRRLRREAEGLRSSLRRGPSGDRKR